jgi:hypothetical protein
VPKKPLHFSKNLIDIFQLNFTKLCSAKDPSRVPAPQASALLTVDGTPLRPFARFFQKRFG